MYHISPSDGSVQARQTYSWKKSFPKISSYLHPTSSAANLLYNGGRSVAQQTYCIIFIGQTLRLRTHIPNEHSSANLLRLPNGFVKNCLASTHGECRADKSPHSHWCWTNILWLRSISDIRGNATKCEWRHSSLLISFCCAHSLLLYHPHIPILDKQMRLFGVPLVYVYTA